ncbi:hypothetical protein ACJJTC_010462 [Scirpophaga incertulas]
MVAHVLYKTKHIVNLVLDDPRLVSVDQGAGVRTGIKCQAGTHHGIVSVQQVERQGAMKSPLKIITCTILLFSVIASAYHSSAKLRRDGVLNLYPFPRVGRASRHTWQVPIDNMYIEYEPATKRQLYAFPRVGRSNPALLRDGTAQAHAEDPGMWFGPRLGRSYKTDEYDATLHNADRSEPEQMEAVHEDRKKRQAKEN